MGSLPAFTPVCRSDAPEHEMIFFSIRAVVLAAATLIAGAAAATPYQPARSDAGLVRIDASDCYLAASGDSCGNMIALIDTTAAVPARHNTKPALYQDLLTPLDVHQYGDAQNADMDRSADDQRTETAADGTVTLAGAQTATPVPEERPYTLLMVGLGLLAFSSRKKRTEKFIA
jgi:hypothetical protein